MKIVNPLVSVIVITYNSSKYVLETLESAKAQTYRNIELIITDDCSTDNTVDVCRDWIEKNKNSFVRTELITVEKNTGIAPNCNRGLYASKGEWLDFVAGDDYLYENRIDECIKTVMENSSIKILFSNVAINGQLTATSHNVEAFFSMHPKKQYLELLKGNILPSPAAFLNKETVIKLNGFNEKYAFLDDYPFFLKALKSGIKLYNINRELVYYRIDQNNISRQNKMNIKYQRSVKLFFKDEFLKELWGNRLYIFFVHFMTEYVLLKLVSMHIIKYRRTYDFFLKWLSIFTWGSRIKKIFVSLN